MFFFSDVLLRLCMENFVETLFSRTLLMETVDFQTLELHSSKNWVTSPSVKLIFMDSQLLSQSPEEVKDF